jgi:oxygen-independent coproporphyrinogen-3 oxidase
MPAHILPGLYIHIPFCRTKCPYCDFYSCTDAPAVRDFTAALNRELLLYCKSFPAVDTVYLGGGTPTVLPDEELAVLMATVRTHVVIAPDAEITIEANPNDLSRERLSHLRSLGFNRLSLGVQSFDDAVLRFLGRRHTADEARQAIKQARSAGFDTVSLDFMYAVPGQKHEDWFATLGEALAFLPEHLSCYQLTIKEETPFFARAQTGEFEPVTDDEQAGLFMATAAFLEEHGFVHYEVSNFCRAENLEARHNRKYWEHAPYLGLGPSAHSFDGRRRWWNVRSVEEYMRRLLSNSSRREKESGQAGMTGKGSPQEINNNAAKQTASAEKKEPDSGFCRNEGTGELPIEGSEELTDDELRSEQLMLGLRTRRGIALDSLLENPAARQVLEKLRADGLVTVAGGRVRPTTRGMLMADSLAAFF